jgi:formate dehydrogenase subunit gamma
MSDKKQSRIRRHRKLAYSLLSLLVLTLVLPLIPYAMAEKSEVAGTVVNPGKVMNPGADLWRAVRQRDNMFPLTGSTQMKSVDAGVLINESGKEWVKFRMQQLIPYGAALMGIILSIIILFYLIRGPLKIQGEPTGKKIMRFTVFERTTHWFTVSIFWLLALTGLILLYGRAVLIPLLGADGFGITASACKEAHNLFGPTFLVAILMLFLTFVKDNIYARGDISWLLKGGGMLGGGHISAGRFNAGEKMWFWIATLGGLVLCITGLILDFSILGQSRQIMALSEVLHGIVALIIISVSFGHIYLGTAGVEGTLGSMANGYVDEAWAKSHHDRWYDEVKSAEAAEGKSDDTVEKSSMATEGEG